MGIRRRPTEAELWDLHKKMKAVALSPHRFAKMVVEENGSRRWVNNAYNGHCGRCGIHYTAYWADPLPCPVGPDSNEHDPHSP